MTKNVYFEHYMFSNVTDKQLDLYRFEDVQTNSSSPKVRIDNRKSESSSSKNSSYMKARIKNQDSESLSSTNIIKHVNNNLKSQFKFTKGNIKFRTFRNNYFCECFVSSLRSLVFFNIALRLYIV